LQRKIEEALLRVNLLQSQDLFEFGCFRLDPAEHLLLRDGEPVLLSPKNFDLLVFLVEHSGRLVTKDQILQGVWQGSFVEEANITVGMSALRKVLGEREGGPQYIETVPKKGYRFTAAVKECCPSQVRQAISGRETSVGTEVPNPPLRVEAGGEKATSLVVPVVLAATGGGVSSGAMVVEGEGTVPTFPRAFPLREGQKSGTRSRVVMPLAIFLVLALAGAAAYLLVKKHAQQRAQGGTRSLAILPFQNLRPDPQSDFLGFSLADAVITKLGYVSALTVRPSSAVQKYRNQVIDISKVAGDLNVDTLLTGNFIHEGDDLRITSQLIDVKTDKILWKGAFDLKYDRLLTVQDNVAQEIIKGLELNLSPSEAERLKPDAPINPLAYEYYLRGIDLYSRHDFPMAIKMLEKSAEIDPNYGLTWAYLGASYNSSAAFEFGGREQYHKARAAYERALAIQPAQLEAKIFLANLLVDTGKVEEAVPLLRDALKTNPNHAAAHWELGYAYRFAGMLEESVAECERALQLDPLVRGANGAVLNTYLYLGEYDKFLRSLPDVDDSSFIVFYRGFGEYYRKDWQSAAKDLDRAYELDPTLYAQIGKALSDSIAGKNVEGLEILRQMEQKIRQRGVGDPEGMYKIAQGYAVLGDKTSAVRVLRSSIENGFFPYPYFITDPLLNGIRREQEFPQLMNSARQRYEAFKRGFF
jgi:DNA-binding winged helix-turn-helix (wHTH) protein/TolB-like protein/Tfp pilus assembly protein PilF